ncbi:hypothetical protein FACS189485_02830 [Spirochaetia bacterium]|nr:hypothetical protein FACS189485_02830 [Spirochaetia bacterium]
MNFSRLKGGLANLSRFKDTAILIGWFAGLLLIGGLLWTLTEPVQGRFLQSAVNRVMLDIGEPLRLEGVPDSSSVNRIPLGKWYTISGSADRMLVFPLMSSGAVIPCGAVVKPGGKVERIIPLGVHGEQLFKTLPQGILRVYIHRIEEETQ